MAEVWARGDPSKELGCRNSHMDVSFCPRLAMCLALLRPRAIVIALLSIAAISARAAVGTPLGWGGYFNGDTPPSATNLVSLHGSG